MSGYTTTTGGQATATTTHPITLPTGDGPFALVIFRGGTSANAPRTYDTGWQSLIDATASQTSILAHDNASSISTLNITTGSNIQSAWIAFRFDRGMIAEAAKNPAVFGSFVPPELVLSGGVQECVWLAVISHHRADNADVGPAPAGYGDLTQYRSSAVADASSVRVAVAARVLEAGAEEPGEFGGTSSGFRLNSEALTVGVVLSPDPPPEPGVVGVPDRLRCSITADSGSILASTRAVPFDASHSIAFNLLRRLPQVEPVGLREVTRAQDDPTADVSFLPRATQNSQSEHTYDGGTILTLMARAYPAPIVARWDDPLVNLPDNLASSWLSWVFARWQTEFPWFDYEPVPDLRLAIPGSTGIALPSEYAPTIPVDRPRPVGGIGTDMLVFRQDRDTRMSMLEMLEHLLSPFPGVIYYQISDGRLRLVPAYGPDADEEPVVTLTDHHVVDMTTGEPDALSLVNRATGGSRAFIPTPETPVMQPAWFQVGPTAQYGSGNWYVPPPDRLNLQTHPSGNTLQEELPPGAAFFNQANMTWPIAPNVFPGGTEVRLVDADNTPLITCAWKLIQRSNDEVIESGTTGLNLWESTMLVPFDGSEVLAFQWRVTVSGHELQVNARMRWDASSQTVRIRLTGAFLSFNSTPNIFVPAITYDAIVEFTLNDESTAYVDSPGPTVTYGVVEDGHVIPTPGGGNAIADSQAAFGVVEARIDVRGYVLSADQMLGVLESHVLANLSPRATRDIRLGVLGSTQLLFDHRGRRVLLPDDSIGRITGVSYADDFVAETWGKAARVEVEIEGAPGQVGTDGVLLQNHDGSWWQNHDSTTSEVP